MRSKKAFTLIELLVVIAIIVVLVGFFVNATGDMSTKSQITKTKSVLNQLSQAVTQFEGDWGKIPNNLNLLTSSERLVSYAKLKSIPLVNKDAYFASSENLSGLSVGFSCPWYEPLLPNAPNGPSWEHLNNAAAGEICKTFIKPASVWVEHNMPVVFRAASSPGDSQEQYPVDAWGNFIFYNPNGPNNNFVLMSAGSDYTASDNGSSDVVSFLSQSSVSETNINSYKNQGFIVYGAY